MALTAKCLKINLLFRLESEIFFFSVLSVCGVIAEANRQLGGIATISAEVDDGLIICKGKKGFLNYAMTKLADVVGNSLTPQLTILYNVKHCEATNCDVMVLS